MATLSYPSSQSRYNALQTLEHRVHNVCLWIVSLLFDFATKNLHLASIFYHLVAKWRLNDFVNFEPWHLQLSWGVEKGLHYY